MEAVRRIPFAAEKAVRLEDMRTAGTQLAAEGENTGHIVSVAGAEHIAKTAEVENTEQAAAAVENTASAVVHKTEPAALRTPVHRRPAAEPTGSSERELDTD